MRRLAILILVGTLAAASCSGNDAESTTTTDVPQATTTSTSTITPPVTTTTAIPQTTTSGPPDAGGPQPRPVAVFAPFTEIPLITDSPAYAGPATPDSIQDLYLPRSMEYSLDAAAITTLEQQGFVVVPSTAPLFHPLYQQIHYEGEVYFVTTDVGYHYLHLAFSKILRELEQTELLPILEDLMVGLVAAARTQRDELAGTDLAEAADRVAQLYEAGATLLEMDVGPIGELAQEEVALAIEAIQFVESPITGLVPADPQAATEGLVDFSLFKPRGHYTRNADLERYFRTMSLLGNENFAVRYEAPMLLATLATRVLVENPELLDAWTLLYEPTAFLVGLADDYTPLEVADQLDALAPGWRDEATKIDAAIAGAVGKGLLATRPIGIDPEGAAVRIMGVRLVIDSYIYDQLRFPNVGDPPWGRRYATPLDLVATFGSELAYRIMEEEGTLTDPDTGRHWTHYDAQLAGLSDLVAERGAAEWGSTVYDAWLYALEPVWRAHGVAYPDFMRTEPWEIKDLQTGLGSYTELKHDTILYAKQSFAAEGDYDPVTYPDPRHWVEPNPVAFARMAAMLGLLSDGLSSRGLLPADGENAELITALDAFLSRLAVLAADELAGRPISAEDNQWLQSVGSTMEALWIQTSDSGQLPGEFPDEDTRAALIADIMRTTYDILEIGTGFIDRLYVLVPDDSGRFQIAQGGVYSYYEFWRPAGEGRLTDEEWWEMLQTNPPDRPAWQQPLFTGGSGYAVGVTRGLGCAALVAEFDLEQIVAYWVAYGMPDNLDGDGNGIPCDEAGAVDATGFFAGLPSETGLFCRDLEPAGYSFSEAVAYWVREGAPDRMDADRNRIPCETIYPAEEVAAFFAIGSGG
jgi:hypothetical protein